MAVLTDLPVELLEQIYHSLGSIDDVHHLARVCKRTNHVIHRRNIYLEIMRSIIHFSPQHRYDFQLCKMLDLHQKIAAHIGRNKSRLPISQPLAQNMNAWEAMLVDALASKRSIEAWSEKTLCDVLARYQGLRVLENIWLTRQLEAEDYLSVDDTLDAQTLFDKFNTLVIRSDPSWDMPLPRRCEDTPHTHDYNGLNPDQRARFYAAVVCVWLLNEIRWAMTNFAYPTTGFNTLIRVLEHCKIEITELQNTPVLDRLDECAAFSFMYHHLLPRHIKFLADRNSSKLPFTFHSDLNNGNGHCHRMFQVCLMAGQVYFQPPDLIDLAVRSLSSRRSPYPEMKIPASSEKWRHPLPMRAPPNISLGGEGKKHLLQQLSLAQLRAMDRASFHQNRDSISTLQSHQLLPDHYLLAMHDYASQFFTDRALVDFEKEECHREGLTNIRAAFYTEWDKIRWEIWWWANGEEKARMKMERWRRPKSERPW